MARSSPEEPLAGFACSRRPLTVSPRSQQRTDVELRLLESGSITLLIGGRIQWLPARRLAVYWAGMPHQVLAHEGRDNWLMRIPLAWLLTLDLPANFTSGLLEGRVFFEPDVDQFTCDQFRLQQWAGDMKARSLLIRRAVALETEGRLARLAAALPAALPALSWDAPPGRKNPTKALRMAGYISQNCLESLDSLRIARTIGLHQNYAIKLFRAELGSTPIDYLTQHRLATALRLLLTTREPLAAVARASGFTALKRLTVNFRQSFGATPSLFRQKLGGAVSAVGRTRV